MGGDNSGSVDKFNLFQRNVNFLKITSLTLFDVSVDSLHASFFLNFSFVLWRFWSNYWSDTTVSEACRLLFRKQQVSRSVAGEVNIVQTNRVELNQVKMSKNSKPKSVVFFSILSMAVVIARCCWCLRAEKRSLVTRPSPISTFTLTFSLSHLQCFIARRPLVTAKNFPQGSSAPKQCTT